MQKPPAASRLVVPDTRWRDWIVALAAGVAVLGFIFYAFANLSHQANASGLTEGVILSKAFVPRPETQISVGKGGLSSQEVAGEYSFQVRVPQENNREYKVLVNPAIYDRQHAGDHLLFKR